MTPAQLTQVRAEFPSLASGFVFLDNAGGSQVLGRVADRIRDYLTTTSVQLGASYAVSQAAGEKVLAARRTIAEMVNANHDEEIVMGGSTTGLMFQFTSALSYVIQPCDEIIVTETDHEANIGGWKRLERFGAVVKMWKVNRETLELDLAELDRLLSPRTKWVAMTWASNVLGTVNPVAEVAKRVHAVGGRLAVDAVAYAPHRLVDVEASGADIVVFSFYKVFGPHYALLWGRHELLKSLPGINHFFIGPDVLPYKLQPGNVNFELSHGCAGIAEYLVDMGTSFGASGSRRERMQHALDVFARHEDVLAERLLAWLATNANIRVIGRPEVRSGDRMPTISFVVHGKRSEDIVRAVDPHGIGIRFGDFYARHLCEALGINAAYGGVVRVSIAHYNSMQEIDRLISALESAIQ
ncbi:MAG: cysteine desulfurase-like protein [Burkholderiales bacterium]|nr:cysteine desulfurase-like protein [Burkholderiales bacterium]